MATIFGTNFDGCSDTAGDPVLHPQLAKALKSLNMKYVRFWTEGSFTSTFPASQWAILLKWHNLGFNVIAVINFQNSPVRCKAVADAIWTKYLNSIPASSATGITHLEIGNELDFSEYYTDTAAAYAHMLQLAYPILHAKGYIVICGNYLYSLNFYSELEALNALQYCDAIGAHAYTGTVAGNIAIIDGVVAFGAKIGKTIICTEGGVRGSASNLPAWATLTQQYYTALQAIAGVILHFPCCTANPPEHPTDIGSILQIPEYTPTPYFNIAMTDTLAVVAPVNTQLSGTPIGTAGSYEN